jgi:anti-anti-sigma factor
MSVEIRQDMNVIVRVAGDIDISNVAEFSDALERAAVLSPTGFIIDLSDATYMDSAGVKVILITYGKIQESNGVLALVSNTHIKNILRFVHLELLPRMSSYDDLEAARKSLQLPANRGT